MSSCMHDCVKNNLVYIAGRDIHRVNLEYAQYFLYVHELVFYTTSVFLLTDPSLIESKMFKTASINLY